VEGVLLARYRYNSLRRETDDVAVREVTVVAAPETSQAAADGAARGHMFTSATMLARDLANTPHSHLTAATFADLAVQLGAETGVDVEVFDEAALREMGIGGLLAINAGSAQPPRMIKLTYRPAGQATGRLAVVAKGVMYDSGGISLKPSDRVHAQMKNDMSGAAATLAAITSLQALGCTSAVTGYLMCTDNMPSGTATGLGDVITIRGGTTMEMIDTDAEGRVIMADALVLAGEDGHDGVVDIATLTGSALRALGTDFAALVGNDRAMVEQVKAAAATTDELVWELPLHRPYRSKLDSLVADIANCAPIGQPDALLAALLLSEFAGDLPWAHIDMCGQAQNDTDRTWHPEGCTGYGARLLLQLILDFQPPDRS
jgi:leucyl aminopeptidase